MKVKKIKSSDLPALFKLWKRAGLSVNNDMSREQKECWMMIELNPTSCLALWEGKKIIGSVFGTFNGRRGWIYHLAVDPKYQNKGYGKLLLNTVEKALKEKGATKILLWINYFNKKISSFYEKNGFSILKDKGKIMGKDLWRKD